MTKIEKAPEPPSSGEAPRISRWQRFWGQAFFHTSRWPMLAITAWVVVIGATIATAVAWLLGRIVFGAAGADEWLVPGPAFGEEGWLAPIKVALTVAAGVGAAVAYRRQRLAEKAEPREIAAAQHARDAELRERERAYRDRYATAADQMGSANPTVRLAGVYAMANLADEWPAQRRQCVEVLCAHLRLPWNPDETEGLATVQVQKAEGRNGSRVSTYIATPGEVEVRRTILRIVGSRLLPDGQRAGEHASWTGVSLDFQGATLPIVSWSGCVISEVSFSGITPFRDHADFQTAKFSDGASFFGAKFLGLASFEGASFEGQAGFDSAIFSEYSNFNGVTFSRQASFVRATFRAGVSFGPGLAVADGGLLGIPAGRFCDNVWFAHARFEGAASFREVSFFKDALFKGAVFVRDADFKAVEFHGIAGFGDPRHIVRLPSYKEEPGACFSGDVDFGGARFWGGAWFRGASFEKESVFPRSLQTSLSAAKFAEESKWSM